MSFVSTIGTPQNWQRLVINGRNPSALLDFSGSTRCLEGAIPMNWWMASEISCAT